MRKKTLAEVSLSPFLFAHLDLVFQNWRTDAFFSLREDARTAIVNNTLIQLVQETPTPCFLLPAILQFIELVNAESLLEVYSFCHFEAWLNRFSNLSFEENRLVRGKIMGRYLPRSFFDRLFPIGNKKIYPGSHYVTAHSSPDLDTLVASFWGWVDAFSAQVSSGLHIWNIPDGPPEQEEVSILFHDFFGDRLFRFATRRRRTLTLFGLDLISTQPLIYQEVSESLQESGSHIKVVVDPQGNFITEWTRDDQKMAGQIASLLESIARRLASDFHMQLVATLSKTNFSQASVIAFIKNILLTPLQRGAQLQGCSAQEGELLHRCLVKILQLPEGLASSFGDFMRSLEDHGCWHVHTLLSLFNKVVESDLFDAEQILATDRRLLFSHIKKTLQSLDNALAQFKAMMAAPSLLLQIKTNLLEPSAQCADYREKLEEIREKIGAHDHMVVTRPNKQKGATAIGVIKNSELQKQILGTVSLRDFSNREETVVPPYLSIISVIDHHKSSLQTNEPAIFIVADVQSANTLCAEQAFLIYDRYHEQLSQESRYFIDPTRELLEYRCYLMAILDDTDLLSKSSVRDLFVVESLLNRLKKTTLGEPIQLGHNAIEDETAFISQAVAKLLKDPDLHSIYSDICRKKKETINKNCSAITEKKPSNFFADTKEQNRCVRVGQSKLFEDNFACFEENKASLQAHWILKAKERSHDSPAIDLHLHMISTIADPAMIIAEPPHVYSHKDELWIWIPETLQAKKHLNEFLLSLKNAPAWAKIELALEMSQNEEPWAIESLALFPSNPKKTEPLFRGFFCLRYPAATVNSRKTMISPFLPRLSG